jgi:hypothetical protein
MLAQECSGIGACRHRPNLNLGMGQQEPKQLSARIASSTRYSNPHTHSHEYAMLCNFMHRSLRTRHASVWACPTSLLRPDTTSSPKGCLPSYTVRWTAPVRSAATATAASRAAAASASVSVRSGARNLSAYASDFFPSPIWGPV